MNQGVRRIYFFLAISLILWFANISQFEGDISRTWFSPFFGIAIAGLTLFLLMELSWQRVSRNSRLKESKFVPIVLIYFPTLLFGLDSLHYSLFQEHLSTFTLTTAYEALYSGEVILESFWYLIVIFFSAIWFLLSLMIIRLLRLLAFQRLVTWVSEWNLHFGYFAVTALIFITIVFKVTPEPQISPLISWSWLSNSALLKTYNSAQASSVAQFNVMTERRQFLKLLETQRQILTQDLEVEQRPNILFIHLESLRGSMLTPENMPRLYNFKQNCLSNQRCLSPSRHFSTGNNSGTGVFGILYGLSGYYYHIAKWQNASSLPLRILKKLGYDCSFYAATDWEYDDLENMFFSPLCKHANQLKASAQHWEAETKMFENYLAEIMQIPATSNPRLDYLVWYSTHFKYYYPAHFEKHKPVVGPDLAIHSGFFPQFKHLAPQLKNRYLNSASYVDNVLGDFLKQMEVAGKLEHTIIVIFGDHGEEFWEHGRFGHGYGLSNEQTQVLFLMHFPGKVSSEYKLGSHHDAMPTLLDFIKLKNKNPDEELQLSSFMTGKSLLRYSPELDFALVSQGVLLINMSYKHMVIDANYKVRFENKGPLLAEAVYNTEDQLLQEFDSVKVENLLKKALLSKSLPIDSR